MGSLAPSTQAGNSLEYPDARPSDQRDVYHGVEVADPYRWMEDEESDETVAWVSQQRQLLDGYVGEVEGLRHFQERIESIREFDSYGIPTRRGEKYFFTRTQAGEKHPVLHVQSGLEGRPTTVLDVEVAIQDPTHGFGGFTPSWDGRHVVWASQAPAGWGWLHVVRVEDGQVVDDRITGVSGNSAIWTHDNAGFFYIRYGEYQALLDGVEPRVELRYHRLGTDPAQDVVHYSRPDRPSLLFRAKLSDDGRYLVLSLYEGNARKQQIVYKDLERGEDFVTLIGEADAKYGFEGNVGSRLFFQTDLDAPRSRLIAIDLDRPQRSNWIELIPQRESTLTSVSHIGGRLVVRSTHHARPIVEVFSTDGDLQYELKLPSIGLLGGFSDDPESSETFFRFNALFDPGTIYRADLNTGKSELFRRPELEYDPDKYAIEQVFYTSKDGTRVPMFVAHRRDAAVDGSAPLLMYGYGHGGWVAFPWFQPHLVTWLDMGGIYALPGCRGGGEYGKQWQEDGILLKKQNTIDDFIAAAEYLIDQGYTSPQKLVANGGSASGVLAAAAIVQRPELFGAAVLDFPFLDMLRYDQFTAIKGWTGGYGSADDPKQFEVLRNYSPYHNLVQGTCYPAVLTIVGGEDTSTVPMHGYKFTAAMQSAQGCGAPALLKFIPGVGHYSYGTDPQEAAATQAEILAFLVRALGLEGGREAGSR